MQSLGRLLDDISITPFTINHYTFTINNYEVSQFVDENDTPRIKVRIVGKIDGRTFVTRINFPASHTFKMVSDQPGHNPVTFEEFTLGLTEISRQFVFQLIADGLQRDAVEKPRHTGTLGDFVDVAQHIIE